MVKPIVTRDTPVLRKVAEEVPVSDITGPEIQRVIRDMQDTLTACEDGLAIAAPQIGESVRIFVVAGRFFPPKSDGDRTESVTPGPDMVFINPTIIKTSTKKKPLEEGCLSVRWLYGDIERFDKVTVSAYDEAGRKFTRGASGLLAQVFQHETDHLNGVLFIDAATNVREILPEDSHRHSHDHDHDDHHGHSH